MHLTHILSSMPALTHVRSLDLNLLLVLCVLLEERSVTRASRRLGLSQSATSRALGRLREAVGDELLVRTRAGMRPTPRALELGAVLEPMFSELEGALGAGERFDPQRVARTFRIGTVDYPVAVLGPPLLATLEREAPHVALAFSPMGDDLDEALEAGEVDLAILPRRESAAGVVWSDLFSDRFVTIARSGHPRVGKRLTVARFAREAHVVVAPDRRATTSAVDRGLESRGLARRVAVRVPSFLVAPLVVAESDAISTMPERLARRFAPGLDLRVLACPLPLPALVVGAAWHERLRNDPGHRWIRRRLLTVLSKRDRCG